MQGKIRTYFTDKGYGFIDGTDGNSYFFHISGTNLNAAKRYDLEGMQATFTPASATVKGMIKSTARDVLIDL